MGLIKCPECGKDISDQAESCPNCGYPIQKNLKEKTEDSVIEEVKDSNMESNAEAIDVIQNVDEEKKENQTKKEGKHIFGWIVCIITLIYTLGLVTGKDTFGAGIIMFLAAMFVCPSCIKNLSKKLNKKISKKIQVIVYIVLFITSASIMPDSTTQNVNNTVEETVAVEEVKETEEEKAQREAEEAQAKKEEEEAAAAEAQRKAEEVAATEAAAQAKKEAEKAAAEAKKAEEESTYKASCESIAYKDIARNPDNYIGKKVKFTGQVVQVQEDYSLFGSSKSITIRLAVTKGTYGFWDDYVYCTYTYSDGESKILEEDIITIYGECKGDTSYISVLGSSVTLPEVAIKYLTIDE